MARALIAAEISSRVHKTNWPSRAVVENSAAVVPTVEPKCCRPQTRLEWIEPVILSAADASDDCPLAACAWNMLRAAETEIGGVLDAKTRASLQELKGVFRGRAPTARLPAAPEAGKPPAPAPPAPRSSRAQTLTPS